MVNITDLYSPQIEKKLVELIESSSGITFDASKKRELKQDIDGLIESHRITSYSDMLEILIEKKDGGRLLTSLINAVTINETYFFRVAEHFDILRKTVIPEILEREDAPETNVRVWCAGCSSGEEVYSIAIALKEMNRYQESSFSFEVIGTDINSEMIKTAKQGIYTGRTLNLVDKKHLSSYFQAVGDQFQVKESVKAHTRFFYLNLKESFVDKFDSPMDIIFFRNVFIYFSRETNRKIIDGFHRLLKAQSYLFLGPSETLWKLSDSFVVRMFENSFIYQKPGFKGIDVSAETEQKLMDTISQPKETALIPEETDGTIDLFAEQIGGRSESGDTEQLPFEENNKDNPYRQIERWIDQGDYDLAESEIDKLVGINERNKEAALLKLIILSNRNDKNGLMAFSERLRPLIPVFPELHFLMGHFWENSGQTSKAIEELKKVIFLDRDLLNPRAKLLDLYLNSGNLDAADIEAKHIIGMIRSGRYKVFESRMLINPNINRLLEQCVQLHGG